MSVKTILTDELIKIPDERVAVMLSAGIDSLSIALTLRALGKQVVAYSFRLENVLSLDYVEACRKAEKFGFEFKSVVLANDAESIERQVREAIALGLHKKADIECGIAFLRTIDAVAERVVCLGISADSHFGISKEAMIHYRDSVKKLDEYRRKKLKTSRQLDVMSEYAKARGIDVVAPYRAKAMSEFFLGKSWDEVNKPRQKQSILDAYPAEFAQTRIVPHTNLQLGDSGIAKSYEILLKSALNTRRLKSVVGIYNDIKKGLI